MKKDIWIGSCLVVMITGTALNRQFFNKTTDDAVELVVTVSSPEAAEAIDTMQKDNSSAVIEDSLMDESVEFLSDHVVVLIYKEGTDEQIGSYAYTNIEKKDIIGLTRQEYHALTDTISEYEYDYFTLVFEDGEGIVYHPQYSYWAMYGVLDEEYDIKQCISYIDATRSQVETVTDSKTSEIRIFIAEMTQEYEDDEWYEAEVAFLYDNIYEVNLTLNIDSEQIDDILNVVKVLEQKANTKDYNLNFNVKFVNMGNEVVTMTFGEEYLKYYYVVNGHRVALDTLE